MHPKLLTAPGAPPGGEVPIGGGRTDRTKPLGLHPPAQPSHEQIAAGFMRIKAITRLPDARVRAIFDLSLHEARQRPLRSVSVIERAVVLATEKILLAERTERGGGPT